MSELTNLVAKQNEESYQLGKKHGAIEELEKIKAEMEKDKIILFYAPQKVEIFNEWIEKLDKRIAELKGENNE